MLPQPPNISYGIEPISAALAGTRCGRRSGRPQRSVFSLPVKKTSPPLPAYPASLTDVAHARSLGCAPEAACTLACLCS